MSLIDRMKNARTLLFKEKDIPNKDASNIMRDNGMFRQPDKKTYLIGSLSPVRCREMALRCPLFLKGSFKRTGDVFNNWFEIVKRKTGEPIGTQTFNVIEEFNERTQLRDKMFIAGICNDIYGDIFLERTFMEKNGDKYIPILDNPSTQPNLMKEPLNINVINPELIPKIERKRGSSSNTEYYHLKKKAGGTVYIHPDRIIHRAEIKLPYSKFGSSKVDVGYNIINALMNTDEISGEILDWFSTGMYFMTKKALNDAEQQKAIRQFEEHPRYIIVDDEWKMDVYNPTRIDPEPFYTHYYTKIAALYRMPRQLLIGAEVGAITGSEVGFGDYVASIHHLREMYGSIISMIYKQLLQSKGMPWDYEIVWNKTYIDELSESKTMEKRALVSTALVDREIITREESRKIMNEGFVRLSREPEGEFIEPNPNAQPMLPNVEPPTKGKPKKDKKPDDGNDGEGKQEPKKKGNESISTPDVFNMSTGERLMKLQDKRINK